MFNRPWSDPLSPLPWQPARHALGLSLAFLLSAQFSTGQDSPPATQPASEAAPATPAQGHSIHGEAFDEGPRQAAKLLNGMGKIDFPVSSASTPAIAFLQQGVAQLHTFYYLEAERSFRQAATLDPQCPLAFWGMAMANVNNGKRAKAFLKEAETQAKAHPPTRRESLYLESLSALYSSDGDDKSRRRKQLETLETLVQEFPTDVDARCWLALLTWQNADKDGIGSRQAVEELIRSAERISPMHPAVHHYRIHLWDGVKPALAENSARLYAPAAPGIAHAWHMPGHTYTGLKRYADAAFQQEGSARVDHAAMSRAQLMPFEIHNYAHNNQWLATSLSNIGRVREAVQMARNLVEQPRDPQKNTATDGGSAQSNGRARWSEALTRHELWDELMTATTSGAIDWSDLPRERKEKAYSLGLAHAAKADKAQLQAQIDALKALEPPKPPAETKPDPATPATGETPPANPAPKEGAAPSPSAPEADKKTAETDQKTPESDRKPAEPDKKPAETDKNAPEGDKKPAEPPKPEAPAGLPEALAELEGYRLLIDGQNEEALESFEKAGSMRQESKARVQLRAGKPDLAVETARKAVEQNENLVAPLAALVEILDAVGIKEDAQAAYQKLAPFLAEADQNLPALVRVQALAARWNPPVSQNQPAAIPREPRPELGYLGPLHWTPNNAPALDLPDTEGTTWRLSEHRGRNVLVLFFLGGGCAHCMQQLQEFSKVATDFESLDTDIVAVSTDDPTASHALKHNKDGISFPMPILANPKLEWFKQFGSHDDFESRPLHGTYLIDRMGKVRFQRISAEPFLDLSFLKQEIARINHLLKSEPTTSASN